MLSSYAEATPSELVAPTDVYKRQGYTRMNRKKSGQSINLRDTDHAKERYAEVANLVRYGKRCV